jgi:hypothetical protein
VQNEIFLHNIVSGVDSIGGGGNVIVAYHDDLVNDIHSVLPHILIYTRKKTC